MAWQESAPAASSPKLLVAALLVSLITLTGSLVLSINLGLRACPLCFYQRTFAMSVAAVLLMGFLLGLGPTGRLGLLALPLATAGLGVALFHVSLEMNGTLECPWGLLGLGTAPQQSLAMFVVLFVLLLADVLGGSGSGFGKGVRLAPALLVGVLLTVASTVANPPVPKAPDRPYPDAVEICRPPYRGS